MCTLCLVAFGAFVAAFAPGSAGTFQQQKINEFQALVETYLPPGSRGALARDRMIERMTRLASAPVPKEPSTWKSCVPFFRPSEKRLKQRAEVAATSAFESVRLALTSQDPEEQRRASAQTVSTLADFYTDLAHYNGDRSNRLMKRAFTLLGPTVVPMVLLGSGVYLASFPEICGALPGPLGTHAHHILLGTGAAGVVGFMGLSVTKRGSDWFFQNGTVEHDRNSGAQRAEVHFWKTIAEAWRANPELPTLSTSAGDASAIANGVFHRLNWSGDGVVGACEEFLNEAPACPTCVVKAG